MKLFYLPLFLFIAFLFANTKCFAQEPALVISNAFINPAGTDDNKEFAELTATRSINFATTPYTVVYSDGSIATAAAGWATGLLGTYAIQISAGTIAKGEKIYVGGNALSINGTSCKLIQKNTSAAGDGGIGTGSASGILGNGGSNADGLAVFNVAASAITNATVPIDAIFYGTAVGNATGKFLVPTNDRYNNAQGKFGEGTNTFVAPDPGANYLLATGVFDATTNLFTTARVWTSAASVPDCANASTITFATANALTLAVNSSNTSFLNPPVVSSVINDVADPAAANGITFTINDNSVAIDASNYTLTASSSNTAVIAVANISITKNNGTANVKLSPVGVGYSDVTLTLTSGGNTKTYVINFAASASGANSSSSTKYHVGNSDASTAEALDDNYMIVSDDEQNRLIVFDRNASGLPIKSFDYSTLLNLTDLSGGVPREIDLEASVRSTTNTNRIYWIGSMSNKSSSAPYVTRPNRNRIFATDVTGTGAATNFNFVGFYDNLRSNIITWGDANGFDLTVSAADGKDPKQIDGFNAEGMCFAPDGTTLYVAFRAPLLPVSNRTRALLVPVTNFETWFGNGNPSNSPILGSPVLLDLGGFGIRSIQRLSNNLYVIIAGNFDDATYNGAIYTWNGNPSDAPVLQPGFDINGMSPESFLQINSGGTISTNKLQVISDNGTQVYYNDGIAAKDLGNNNLKKFRSDIITSVGAPLPVIFNSFTLAIQQTNTILLTWNGNLAQGLTLYEVQRAQGNGEFITIGSISSSNESNFTFTDRNLPAGKYEYRIKATGNDSKVYYSTARLALLTGAYSKINIYNNPIRNEELLFTTNEEGKKQIRILSADGTKIYSTNSNAQTIRVPMVGKAAGIYILQMETANGKTTSTFIK